MDPEEQHEIYRHVLAVWEGSDDRRGLPHPGDALFLLFLERGRPSGGASEGEPGEGATAEALAPPSSREALTPDEREKALRRLHRALRHELRRRRPPPLDTRAVLDLAMLYLSTLRGDDPRELACEYLEGPGGEELTEEDRVPPAVLQEVLDRIGRAREIVEAEASLL